MPTALALDIGGTKLAAAVVADGGTVVSRSRRPTSGADAEDLFAQVTDLLDQVRASAGPTVDRVDVLGVGCGGPMTRSGETVSPLNIHQWRGFPLRARLAEWSGLPTFVDNDAKALALGEGWQGAAQGESDYLAMVVSTGVGAGIVVDGRLLDGADGNAGHLGHMIVDPLGRACVCGARGCLEAMVSGTAIAAATGRPAAEAPEEVRVWAGRLVGRAVASVANLLDLRVAVVAGSVALGYGDVFFDAASAEADRCARLDFSPRRADRAHRMRRRRPGARRRSGRPARHRLAAGRDRRRVTVTTMEPTYPPEAEVFRTRIRTFLEEQLPADWHGTGGLPAEDVLAFMQGWRKILADNGLLASSWPTAYGGAGMSPLEQVVMAEEFYRAGVPLGGPNDVFSIQMFGNTMLMFGTEEQKQHYIPRILSGEDVWCQGYSEPNAGSDLANLACRAVLDGDEWVINGQKIWTSMGHLANKIFVLARTTNDPSKKHVGITFLMVDMDQPGVEVRPIEMMSGESEFNEVFFTDARCPKENVLGQVDGGWTIAMGLLGFERGEAAATVPIIFRNELDRLLVLAKEHGRADDPLIRQQLASAYARVEIMRYLGMRTLTDFLAGKHPGPDAAITKLYWSEYHTVVTELAVDILGAEAMTPDGRWPSTAFQADDPGAPNDSASWVGTFFNARAGTIYAGTSQVQRNIIGEMILGLPKEPRVPKPA